MIGKYKYILLVLLLMLSCFAFPLQKVFASSISDNSVIVLSGNINQSNQLVIKATMVSNTGLNAMTLELSYNKNAMRLSNVEFGTALSSLNPITTNTNREQGYSITPFKINYLGDENDTSTGTLFTMTFVLLDNVKDGKYTVSLNYNKDEDVTYVDDVDGVKTKNLSIDNAEIEFKDSSVKQIRFVNTDNSSNIFLIVAICISSIALVTSGVLVATKLLKKQRNWKRL